MIKFKSQNRRGLDFLLLKRGLGWAKKYVKNIVFAIFFDKTLAMSKKSSTFAVANLKNTSRGGAVVARWAHNPKVGGSSPPPATKKAKSKDLVFFLFILKKVSNFVARQESR